MSRIFCRILVLHLGLINYSIYLTLTSKVKRATSFTVVYGRWCHFWVLAFVLIYPKELKEHGGIVLSSVFDET